MQGAGASRRGHRGVRTGAQRSLGILCALAAALLAGRGDLVVDNLTVTPSRRERVSFSAPVAAVRQQVVSRVDDGVRYLAFLRASFDETLPDADRTWLALASYNAGPGHVSDARALARERGPDPDRWFGNLERAMLLKPRRDVAAATRFGYCRCDEAVRYVRAVRDRYRAYMRVAASDGAAEGGESG